jgi:hypothetical protein
MQQGARDETSSILGVNTKIKVAYLRVPAGNRHVEFSGNLVLRRSELRQPRRPENQ